MDTIEIVERDTKDVVREMLMENTGRGLCDSGDAYGRNWERNQGRDFDKEPAVKVSFGLWENDLEVDASISLYHWMLHNLEYDAEMQARLDELANRPENERASWHTIADEFAEEEQARLNEEWGGRDREYGVCNTYNESDRWDLTQVLEFRMLYAEGSYEPTHLVLQVHGGCDVRGGYSAPKCFRIKYNEYEWMESASVSSFWAGNWYWDYGCNRWYGVQSSSIESSPDECPPSLPEDILKTEAFRAGEVPEDALDSWHVQVTAERKAFLHAPRGYINEDDDVGPWEIQAGNHYL